MSSSFAAAVRDAFEGRHVPSPGLENRVLGAIAWDRRRTRQAPRLNGALAAAAALVVVALLAVPAVLTRLAIPSAGAGGPRPPAYSLAAVDGQTVLVVQRDLPEELGQPISNALLQSVDGGRTWRERLRFEGVFVEAGSAGRSGYVAAIDGSPTNCDATSHRCQPPTGALHLYRTADGGASWTAMPATAFPVKDVYFLDAARGWAVSEGPSLNAARLYATVDGGATWSEVGPLPAEPSSWASKSGRSMLVFTSATRAWWDGEHELDTSADGGRTWSRVEVPAPPAVAGWTAGTVQQPLIDGSEGLLALAYIDRPARGNAAASHIYLFTSHDGGLTWGDPRPAPAGFTPVGEVVAATLLDTRHAWLTRFNGQLPPAVARTADAGASWTASRGMPYILATAFADPQHGFAIAISGPHNVNQIVRTADGGATWQRVDLPVIHDR